MLWRNETARVPDNTGCGDFPSAQIHGLSGIPPGNTARYTPMRTEGGRTGLMARDGTSAFHALGEVLKFVKLGVRDREEEEGSSSFDSG